MFLMCLVLAFAGVDEKAPITGRLIDSSTKEPVADFEVSVELRRREPIRVVTDAGGFFATEAEFGKTRYSLGLLDHPRSQEPRGRDRARVTHDPAATEVQEFRVESGARFALELVDADGKAISDPTRFDAFLYHDRPLARALPQGGKAPRTPVRVTEGTWTRFRDRHCEVLLAGGPWWLELRSLDGLHGSGVRIESLRPETATVQVVVMPRCVLDGRVLDQDGVALAGAALRLKQADDLTWHETQVAGEDGSFWFGNMESGEYELIVCDPRAIGLRQRVSLAIGEDDGVQDVVVERFSGMTVIAGRISSLSGKYSAGGEVILEPLDKELFERPRAALRWKEDDDGKVIADFEIEVPKGERYRVLPETLDICSWGSVGEVTAGGEPLVIELDDRRQLLEILIEDAENEADIEAAEFAVNLGLYNDWLVGTYVEVEDVPLVVRPDALNWCVTAPEYVAVFGDLSAFSEVEDGARSLLVQMQRGWGNRFEVYDRRTLRPLSGVRIRLDEIEVGVTENGGLDVRLGAAPNVLDVELDGWRWVGGSEEYRREDLVQEGVVPTLIWMIDE